MAVVSKEKAKMELVPEDPDREVRAEAPNAVFPGAKFAVFAWTA